jgi:hypothetical protein
VPQRSGFAGRHTWTLPSVSKEIDSTQVSVKKLTVLSYAQAALRRTDTRVVLSWNTEIQALFYA